MHIKRQTLLRSTTIVSVMTFMSRLLGFVRDMVIAQLFGAQAAMDAFYVAYRIPNFMRRLFAEGAFAQAFVPVLSEYQQQRRFDEVREFIARISGQLSAVLMLVTLLGLIGAPLIISLFAPGFGEHSLRSTMAIEMLRLTFPFLMLVSLTALSGAILNTYGYFAVPAFTPVLLNISMIVAAVYLCPKLPQPVVGLAWGVLLAGIMQLLFQLPFLFKHKLLIRPKLALQDDGVRRVLKLMVPALFGVSIAQINLLIDSIFASFLKIGSVTWLYYTDRLTDFPLGVFGVAIATVILPHLSRRFAVQSEEKYSAALDWGLRLILLIGIPAGLGLAILSMPIIATCFAYGKFSSYDLLQTQKSLIALSLGVPPFMIIKVLASGFYARQDIRTPVVVGAWTMIINSFLCLLLIWPLAHAGLALASALAGYINCASLLIILRKRGEYTPTAGWSKFLGQIFIANLILVWYLLFVTQPIDFWLTKSPLHRMGVLGEYVTLAFFIYFITLWLLRIKPAQFREQVKE